MRNKNIVGKTIFYGGIVNVLIISGVANGATITNMVFLAGTAAGTEPLNLASPGQVLAGGTPYQYNGIDNVTGTKLTTSNGDSPDFTLSGSASFASPMYARSVLGVTGASTPFPAATSGGRITSQQGISTSASVNNPGTIGMNSTTLLFSSSMSITNASFNFSSLNTSGVSWEYSVIRFLDVNGVPFSPLTSLAFTPGAAGQYLSAGAGFTGAAGAGNYLSASTGTVTGVGAQTAIGTGGSGDDLATFGYALAGLAPGTQIGGITWTTYLEDVRGIGNSSSNFTSSLLDFTISGTIIPEPSSLILLGFSAVGLFLRRRS